MDNVCNRCLFSIPSKVEMAEEQEYLRYTSPVLDIDELKMAALRARKVSGNFEKRPQDHSIWRRALAY